MTIGVIAFALVGLMGILPVALEQTRTCVNETRAAHLARMIFSTLQTEPYKAAKVFSTSEEPIDLSDLHEDNPSVQDDVPAITLYATYTVRTGKEVVPEDSSTEEDTSEFRVVRADVPPAGAEYKIIIRARKVYRPQETDPGAPQTDPNTKPPLRGQDLRLTITQVGSSKVVFEGVQFLSRLQSGVQPQ